MGYRRIPFAPGEWYHLYSRGIDKRKVFLDGSDYKRFQKLLYLANDVKPVNFSELKDIPRSAIFALPRTQTVVSIAAYCLMGNHPHLVVQEREEGGITAFMHRMGTAYAAYFNAKYDRIGNLMVRPFRSKHVAGDEYFHYLVQYVHLNPAELYEPGWKEGNVRDFEALERKLRVYPFSSLPDYAGSERPERSILDTEAFTMIRDNLSGLRDVLADAALYYAEVENDLAPHPRGRPKKATPFN